MRRLLEQQRAEGHVSGYRSYWVFNGLAVDGDLSAALALAARDDVQAVRRNRVHRLPAPVLRSEAPLAPIAASEPSWNLVHVGAKAE